MTSLNTCYLLILLQWRTEGLQRPRANACIAPPPELAPPPPAA